MVTPLDGPPAAPPASPLAPEQIAAARADWISHGYSAESFDLAMSGAPTAPAPGNSPVAPPTTLDTSKHPTDLSARQAIEMADALLASGADPAKVQAALDELGVKRIEDPRSTDERKFDTVFAPAEPHEYAIDWQGRVPEGFNFADVAKLDGNVRGMLTAIGMPAQIGGALAEFMFEDAATYGRYDEAGQALWDAQQRSELARVVGDGKVDEAIKNAAAVVKLAKEKHPEFVEELFNHGALRSARVVALLHQQAERMQEREALAERRTKR
jgi:hypothetical protein